jgi:hypothetical protein
LCLRKLVLTYQDIADLGIGVAHARQPMAIARFVVSKTLLNRKVPSVGVKGVGKFALPIQHIADSLIGESECGLQFAIVGIAVSKLLKEGEAFTRDIERLVAQTLSDENFAQPAIDDSQFVLPLRVA